MLLKAESSAGEEQYQKVNKVKTMIIRTLILKNIHETYGQIHNRY